MFPAIGGRGVSEDEPEEGGEGDDGVDNSAAYDNAKKRAQSGSKASLKSTNAAHSSWNTSSVHSKSKPVKRK